MNVVIEWFKKVLQMSSLVTLKDNPNATLQLCS
jgi:hypothetical protein